MKKILSALLVVCMLCAVCVPAMGANITTVDVQSANTVVQYGVSTRYTITIPDTLQLDATQPVEATVSISNALLPSRSRLDVQVTAESYSFDDNAWVLTDVANNQNTLRYTLHQGDTEYAIRNADTVLSIRAGQQSASTNLNISLLDTVQHAGVYRDTITFTVNLLSAVFSVSRPPATTQQVSSVLSENSWSTIQQVVQSGKAAETGWAVGDETTVMLNGESVPVILIGLDQDGENTATFLFKNGVGQHVMNEEPTNYGGYLQSDMYQWLNNTVYNQLDEELQSMIQPVYKNCSLGGKSLTAVEGDYHKLFLLSLKEAGFDDDVKSWGYVDAEAIDKESDFVYDYFNNNASARESMRDSVGGLWWMRTALPTNSQFFFFVAIGPGSFYANYQYPAVPAFVIG